MKNGLAGAAGLLHGVAALLNTANALRPPTNPGRLTVPSFAGGALTTQLPAVAAAATLLPQLALAAAADRAPAPAASGWRCR